MKKLLLIPATVFAFTTALYQTVVSQNTTVYIPTVVHVVWNNSVENIPDTKILAQIQQLNEDYSKTNSDTVNIPAIWQAIATDTKIQFCLASQDPNGNPTNGIVRKQTTFTSFNANGSVQSSITGGDDPWDVYRYFNIWICDLGVVLADSIYPPIRPVFGSVVNYGTVGSLTMPGFTPPFNLGRTLTSEVAHCFYLFHLDAAICSVDKDSVPDTPTSWNNYTGCPSFPQSDPCGTPMTMNFMSYTDDSCRNFFTAGQKARMWNTINNYLDTLLSSNGCTPVGVENYFNRKNIFVSPNPFCTQTVLQTDNLLHNATLTIYNSFGQTVKQIKNISGQEIKLQRDNLPGGLYFLRLTEENKTLTTEKIIIADK